MKGLAEFNWSSMLAPFFFARLHLVTGQRYGHVTGNKTYDQ
jgi:hypothetical protein